MKHVLAAGLILAGSTVSAGATDLNMQSGLWKMVFQADAFGEIITDEDQECTSAEDLNMTASGFVSDMLIELNCQISTSSESVNLFEGKFTCSASSALKRGDYKLVHSPTALSLIVQGTGSDMVGGKKMSATILTHRIGACPS